MKVGGGVLMMSLAMGLLSDQVEVDAEVIVSVVEIHELGQKNKQTKMSQFVQRFCFQSLNVACIPSSSCCCCSDEINRQ